MLLETEIVFNEGLLVEYLDIAEKALLLAETGKVKLAFSSFLHFFFFLYGVH